MFTKTSEKDLSYLFTTVLVEPRFLAAKIALGMQAV